MEEDRLSALPEEIITNIFSFLPINSVVQTSILSKCWLHRWKLAHVLRFPSLPEFELNSPPIDYSFVDRCLDLHTAPNISKFIVFARLLGGVPKPNVDKWIDFAINRYVRSLELYLLTGTCFKVPNSLYYGSSSACASSSLEHLALSFVEFNPPPPSLGFTGYPLLNKLFLHGSIISDEGIQSIMETCEALQYLSLIFCSGLINLNISSLSLKEFEYLRYGDENLIEIDAPNLETLNAEESKGIISLSTNCLPVKVNFSMGNLLDDRGWVNARRFGSQLFHVEFLGISKFELKLIAEAIQNEGGPCCTFKNLKTLFVDGLSFSEYDLVVLLAILQDCPTLNKLQIETLYLLPPIPKVFPSSDRLWDKFPNWNWRNTRFPPLKDGEAMEFRNKIRPIHQLKEIELFYYRGRKDEEEFVKGLLLYVMNLEKVILYFNQSGHHILKHDYRIDVPKDEQEGLLKELCMLPRASPHVEFVIG